MDEAELQKYAQRLYQYSDSAVRLRRAEIEGGDWQPAPNNCHENVSIWCECNPQFEAVRGWLYFALPGLNFVKFVAHSAARAPDGHLYDITPSAASEDYPFIESDLGEEDYAHIVEDLGYGELYHYMNCTS